MGQQGDSRTPSRRIGRPTIGDRPMTGAEREAKRRLSRRQSLRPCASRSRRSDRITRGFMPTMPSCFTGWPVTLSNAM